RGFWERESVTRQPMECESGNPEGITFAMHCRASHRLAIPAWPLVPFLTPRTQAAIPSLDACPLGLVNVIPSSTPSAARDQVLKMIRRFHQRLGAVGRSHACVRSP